jgi:hypothetical protein
VTEAEQHELYQLVAAAFDAKDSPEFAHRVEEIVGRWRDRYEFWLVRNRDRQRGSA